MRRSYAKSVRKFFPSVPISRSFYSVVFNLRLMVFVDVSEACVCVVVDKMQHVFVCGYSARCVVDWWVYPNQHSFCFLHEFIREMTFANPLVQFTTHLHTRVLCPAFGLGAFYF